jgi:hypothetical protein
MFCASPYEERDVVRLDAATFEVQAMSHRSHARLVGLDRIPVPPGLWGYVNDRTQSESRSRKRGRSKDHIRGSAAAKSRSHLRPCRDYRHSVSTVD